MVFLKIFKPKWEHHDDAVRLTAVRQLDGSDQALLAQIVAQDQNNAVQQAALEKIIDQQLLENLLSTSAGDSIKGKIVKRLDTLYAAEVLGSQEPAQKAESLKKITDEHLLAEIAVKALDTDLRLQAVEKISSGPLLLQVVTGQCGKEPGLRAINKISDLPLLEEAAVKAGSRSVRAAARDKIIQLRGPDQEELQKIRAKEIQKLRREAEKLSLLPDPESAHEKMAAVLEKWNNLAVDESDEQAILFQKAADVIANRLAHFIKHTENEKQRIETFDLQFSQLINIFNDISELTDQSDEGFPERLGKISESWESHLGAFSEPNLLPEEFISEFNCLKKANLKKSKKISAERKLLAKINQLVSAMDSCFQNESYPEAESYLSQCRQLYSPDFFQYLSGQEFTEKINSASSRLEEHKRVEEEDRQKRIQDNISKRQSLIQEVLGLCSEENIPQAQKRFHEIEEIWSEKLDAPNIDAPDLETKFQEAVNRFQEVCEKFYQEKDWQLWTNKTLKEKLIVEMKDLEKIEDLHLVFKEIKRLQEQWNSIGDVPVKEAGKLWNRFKKAADSNFKRCQEFFVELDTVAAENLEKKLLLIQQAEEHKESCEWNKSANALKDLQDQWKKIGRLRKEKEDEVYSQFREVCACFFNRRAEHFKQLSEQRRQNLNEKEKLCLAVEEIMKEPSLECGKKIQELQQEWKKIGPTPKNQEDKIWSRFRLACNNYYEWLDTLKPGNLLKKEEICASAEELIGTLDPQFSNLEDISRKLISLQKEWKNIGPAPKPQENEVWKRFRKICDSFFSKRKDHYDDIDRQQPINEEKKKEYIQAVQRLSQTNDKKNVATIIRMQEEWKNIGPATKKNEAFLDKQFKECCDSFFKARRENFEELDRIRRENLKKKEELCVRLELLSGNVPAKNLRQETNAALSLAEQLKLAFESNFVLAGEDKDSKRRKKDELFQIQKEWDSFSGEVPREHEHAILKRYKKALRDCLEKEKGSR